MTADQFALALCWIGALSLYAGSVIFLLSQPKHEQEQSDERSERKRF
ncbi:hypothetical protein ACI2VP_05065 [Ralstonia nicotianae]